MESFVSEWRRMLESIRFNVLRPSSSLARWLWSVKRLPYLTDLMFDCNLSVSLREQWYLLCGSGGNQASWPKDIRIHGNLCRSLSLHPNLKIRRAARRKSWPDAACCVIQAPAGRDPQCHPGGFRFRFPSQAVDFQFCFVFLTESGSGVCPSDALSNGCRVGVLVQCSGSHGAACFGFCPHWVVLQTASLLRLLWEQSQVSPIAVVYVRKLSLSFSLFARLIPHSAIALAKLLQHAIETNDSRLQSIEVKGEPVYSQMDSIRTRSKSAQGQCALDLVGQLIRDILSNLCLFSSSWAVDQGSCLGENL